MNITKKEAKMEMEAGVTIYLPDITAARSVHCVRAADGWAINNENKFAKKRGRYWKLLVWNFFPNQDEEFKFAIKGGEGEELCFEEAYGLFCKYKQWKFSTENLWCGWDPNSRTLWLPHYQYPIVRSGQWNANNIMRKI